MNRFFRSALFPLIIIVVLAYLAMQTLMRDENKAEKQTLSQVKARIDDKPGTIDEALFDPRKQQFTLTLRQRADPRRPAANGTNPKPMRCDLGGADDDAPHP